MRGFWTRRDKAPACKVFLLRDRDEPLDDRAHCFLARFRRFNVLRPDHVVRQIRAKMRCGLRANDQIFFLPLNDAWFGKILFSLCSLFFLFLRSLFRLFATVFGRSNSCTATAETLSKWSFRMFAAL